VGCAGGLCWHDQPSGGSAISLVVVPCCIIKNSEINLKKVCVGVQCRVPITASAGPFLLQKLKSNNSCGLYIILKKLKRPNVKKSPALF